MNPPLIYIVVLCSGTPGLSAATTPETPAPEEHMEGLLGEMRPHSMLVMSGGEGYIDFRIGKYFLLLRYIILYCVVSMGEKYINIFFEQFISKHCKKC
jgi:hypothetical protein